MKNKIIFLLTSLFVGDFIFAQGPGVPETPIYNKEVLLGVGLFIGIAFLLGVFA